jgi:hypothetical protein
MFKLNLGYIELEVSFGSMDVPVHNEAKEKWFTFKFENLHCDRVFQVEVLKYHLLSRTS